MHARMPLVIVSSLLLLAAACSAGGGGTEAPGQDVVEDTGNTVLDTVTGDDAGGEPDIVTGQEVVPNPDSACQPECGERECGLDPVCGASCGSCENNEVCNNGVCECIPNCDGRDCGDDGCGGSCGECDESCSCIQGVCAECAGCDPGTACMDWFSCTAACPEGDGLEACEEACNAALRPASREARDALVQCHQVQCGACEDQACLDECDAGICHGESVDCLVTYGCGIGACLSFESCVSGCVETHGDGEGYAGCEIGCYRNASTQGLSDALALRDCLSDNCGDAADAASCEADAVLDPDLCRGEATPCMDLDPFCDPSVETCLDCVELLDCLDVCPEGDDDCLFGCAAGASEDAYLEMRDLYECIEGFCDASLSEAEWDSCAEEAMGDDEKCQAEAEPCVEDDNPFCDPETETCLDCAGLVDCVEACGDDSDCVSGCMSDASVTAIGLMQGFYSCVAQYCNASELSQAEWDACVEDAGNDIDQCATQHGACFGDG